MFPHLIIFQQHATFPPTIICMRDWSEISCVFSDMSLIIDGRLCLQILVGESLIKAEDPGRAIVGLFGKELLH